MAQFTDQWGESSKSSPSVCNVATSRINFCVKLFTSFYILCIIYSMTDSSIVSVGALGGTIAMMPSTSGGVSPELDAKRLLDMLDTTSNVRLRAHSLASEPSVHLDLNTVISALNWARSEIDSGANGIVLTQGTDTLEEVAFLLDIFWDRAAPLIITGAMRNPSQPGADGMGNLAAAIAVAEHASSRGRGVLVVMGDVIHRAARVRKNHTSRPDAFASEAHEGLVVEGYPVFYASPSRSGIVLNTPSQVDATGVYLIEQTLADDGELLRVVLANNPRGIVLGAAGAGHVSIGMAETISTTIQQGIPLVVSSRTGGGTTLEHTYGYLGAELDLISRGALMAGWLSPRFSRLLLVALLNNQADMEEMRKTFAAWSGGTD